MCFTGKHPSFYWWAVTYRQPDLYCVVSSCVTLLLWPITAWSPQDLESSWKLEVGPPSTLFVCLGHHRDAQSLSYMWQVKTLNSLPLFALFLFDFLRHSFYFYYSTEETLRTIFYIWQELTCYFLKNYLFHYRHPKSHGSSASVPYIDNGSC